MAAVFAFLGMLLISMVVALLAALQLGDFFNAGEGFALVILGVAAFTILAMAVFSLVYATTRWGRALTSVALLLAAVALAPVVLPGLVQAIADRSASADMIEIETVQITLELVIPALLAVLVQWGLVRRRWLRVHGEEDLTRWPWIATAVAGLIILNPYGLAFLQGTLNRSGGDFLWEFTTAVTGAVFAGLLVMAWVECYIRERLLDRRLDAFEPSSRDAAPDGFLQGASDVRNH